ncbi:MAG: ECF-type sigma factor, partial [Planctomycetota bacterium]
RSRQKRGAGMRRAPINVVDLAGDQDSAEILALDDALCRLGELSPDAAQVVRLRFYAGLSIDEVAETLEMSPRTVDRRWKYVRARLYQMLTESSEEDREPRTSNL